MNWRKLWWKAFGFHQWVYRNPYERHCSTCGRLEVEYCRSLREWHNSWWEVHAAGTEEKHYQPGDKPCKTQ